MKTLITSIALAMVFAVSANADLIHETDFEAEPTVGLVGVQSSTMGFNDAGGDLATDLVGISNANPNSGSFHYAVDVGNPVDNGNGWGGSWNGQNTEGGSGGFTDQATAIANGSGCYVDFSEGATFTASSWFATDAVDAWTGGGIAHMRLEFAAGATADVIPRAFSVDFTSSDLTTAYQQATVSYTLTAADVAAGVDSVSAVIGTDGNGFGAGDGLIYADDFLFEVNAANVVVVGDGHSAAVPEPSTASLLLAGLMGLCGVRRRKS